MSEELKSEQQQQEQQQQQQQQQQPETSSSADRAILEVLDLINFHIIKFKTEKQEDSAWRMQYCLYRLLANRMED